MSTDPLHVEPVAASIDFAALDRLNDQMLRDRGYARPLELPDDDFVDEE